MHISEGILNPYILSGGAVFSGVCIAIGLKRIEPDKLILVALLSAAFFVASLIHVPIGPSSAHLILNGLLGALLGWAAFPAIFVALVLQAILFQYGGITTLGINTLNMALPAVLCYYVFRPVLIKRPQKSSFAAPHTGAAFGCGALSVGLAAMLTAGTLVLNGDAFYATAKVMLLSSLPIMLIEGIITAGIIGFLYKVRPEILFDGSTKATDDTADPTTEATKPSASLTPAP